MSIDLLKKPKQCLLTAGFVILATVSLHVHAIVNLRMQTDLGGVDMELFDTQAVMNVDNFLNYVTDGDYNGTFFHRSIPGFILQGGGYIFNPDDGSLVIVEGDFSGNGGSHIPEDDIVVENEADPVNRPNLRGTITMALGSGPDSAGSDWFVNLVDNPSLDDPADPNVAGDPGPFTVIGQITGNGMDVIDAIVAQPRCFGGLLAAPVLCGPGNLSLLYKDTPLVGMSAVSGNTLIDNVTSTPLIHQYNLINILHIGADTDGDGIADELEDEGANAGDVNNDTIPDRDQQDIASYRATSGSLITLETTAGVVLESTSFMGRTFAFTTFNPISPPGSLEGFEFTHGHIGFMLNNITDPGGKATVTMTIAGTSCQTVGNYFQYGPTPDDLTPHWYEFGYDAQTDTGAEINGSIVTLHYVDGMRGDSSLAVAGTIETLGGSATSLVLDNDGVLQFVEDGAPNDGDGNNDGICDSEQGNVVSLPAARSDYVTIEAPAGLTFSVVGFAPASAVLAGQDLSALGDGVNLPFEFLGFNLGGLANNGDSVDVKLIFPEGTKPVSYYMFGPTPDNDEDHLYEFLFDADTGTGATFNGNEVTLSFVDGERGDFDLMANGVIVDPGTPATFAASVAPSTGGSSSGGCSLGEGPGRPAQAGAWYLLLFLGMLYGIRRFSWRARQGDGSLKHDMVRQEHGRVLSPGL